MKVKEKDSNVIEKAEKIVNTKKENKRDASVDLIRIVACLFVIATHMSLQVLNQAYNRIDWSRLLEKLFSRWRATFFNDYRIFYCKWT